jgi:hypothetical protein
VLRFGLARDLSKVYGPHADVLFDKAVCALKSKPPKSCLDYLKIVRELVSTTELPVRGVARAALAALLLDWLVANDRHGCPAVKIDVLRLALKKAVTARDEYTIHAILQRLSELEFKEGDIELSAEHLSIALGYTRSLFPISFIEDLEVLASVWQRSQDTVVKAYTVYDLLGSMCDPCLRHWVRRDRCAVAVGQSDRLLAVAGKKVDRESPPPLRELASTLSAQVALNLPDATSTAWFLAEYAQSLGETAWYDEVSGLISEKSSSYRP